MSAADPTPAQLAAWVGNFETGGELEEQDGPTPTRSLLEVRYVRGLSKMVADDSRPGGRRRQRPSG